MANEIFLGNDNVIELNGLKLSTDVATTYQNDATVKLTTLKDSSGSTITGPITMTYVAASNGIYRGEIDDAITLVADAIYIAFIDVTSASGKKAHWETPVTAKVRS